MNEGRREEGATHTTITPYDLLLARQNNVRIKKLTRAKRNLQRFSSVKANAIHVKSQPQSLELNCQKTSGMTFSDYLDLRNMSSKTLSKQRQGQMRSHHRPEFLTPVMKIRNGNYRSCQRRISGFQAFDTERCPPELDISQLYSPANIDSFAVRRMSHLLNPSHKEGLRLRKHTVKSHLSEPATIDHDPAEYDARLLTDTYCTNIRQEVRCMPIKTSLKRQFEPTGGNWRRGTASRSKKTVFSGLRSSEIVPWESTTNDDDNEW